MKIGIQTLAYNCHNVIEEVLNPWINLKNQYDVKIWVGSGQFKIYKDLGYENKNEDTLKILNRLLSEKKIDYLFTPDKNNLLGDHTTRDKSVQYFIDNDIDLMIQLDSDEFYTEDEVKNYINFIESNSGYTCYNTVFKNLIGDGSKYNEWSRFSAARIKEHGGISHYYYDCHWSFNGDKKVVDGITSGSNVEYRWVPTKTIPKELVHPIHDTWTNNRKGSGDHIKSKIEYQKKYYNHDCGWFWDEEKETIVPNEKMWEDGSLIIKNLKE